MVDPSPEEARFPAGSSAMAHVIRAHDWSGTPVGPLASWPAALRIALNLMLTSPESMYLVWGAELTFFFNDAYRPILGPRVDGALGASLPVLWADAWSGIKGSMEKALAGAACRFEDVPITMARRGVEEETWWTYSFSPLHDETGRIAGALCFTRETTAQVTSAKALRESEQRLTALIRSSSEVRYAISADWGVLAELAGGGFIPDTATANANWLAEYIPEEDRAAVRAEYERAIRTKTDYSLEHRVNRVDGTVGWAFSRAVPLLDPAGEITGWLGAASDVTDRRRAEGALRALNATLAEQVQQRTQERNGLWEISRDLFMVADTDGVILSVNPAWAEVLGWDEQTFIGRTTEWIEHPDDNAKTRAEVINLAQGRATVAFENRYRTKDGSYRHLSWTAVPADGLLYCSARDVTEARQQSTLLSNAEDALRQSQKMEAVGQLTGGVAHDFNNLLTVIKSSTDLLKRPGLSEERRTRYIGAISDTVDRAARLTGQLLAFARRQTLQPEVFAACDGVRAITEMVGTLTGARIRLVTDLPERRIFINADPSQFDTALVNMAVNARDAMDGEGQITIAVRSAETMPARRAHTAVDGAYVVVSLRDTGAGIAPDKLSQIFEPFFTTKEVGKGTGLGLSQVFGFAKQSGGDVMVSSVVGEGTTFTLYLPRVAETPRKAVKALGPDLLTIGHETCVLVVEDNADVGSFSVQALIELGYLPILAANADEALAELEKDAERFDVVFTDVVMPGTNGIELAKEIQRRHPDLPVVLTSGYSHVLAQEGTHGFELLNKPYSIEQLSRTLYAAIVR